MERNIQQYWQQIVDSIKATRKEQNVTQERLAAITGISTQTISRFEQAKEDIQLSTIFKILDCFGMSLDSHSYSFKLLIYKLLIDAIRNNSKEIKGLLQDVNENTNEIYQFLKNVSKEASNHGSTINGYPLILNWQDFMILSYTKCRSTEI